jgi:peptidoglycan biosynthesis protein MviN/MurJ (putative lipid II flippase)
MFMAVQAALLPRLARLAAAEAHLDFRAAFKRLLVVVVGVAILGTIVAAAIGPFVGKLLFSPEKFQISNINLGVLAAGSGAFIIGQTVAQALIALKKYAHVAISLAFGCFGFAAAAIALAGESDAMLRARVATAGMLISMAKDIRGPLPDGMTLIETIESEAIEI